MAPPQSQGTLACLKQSLVCPGKSVNGGAHESLSTLAA